MTPSPTNAEQITKASKSNLALAFFALSPDRRHDISVFYAFCRVIDDIADDPEVPIAERSKALNHWRASLQSPVSGDPPMAPAVRELIAKYHLPVEHFQEIIAGCEMDLVGTTYQTWDDLQKYCHRVASVVGLVSIEIFGYRDPLCKQYALQLGLALQLTNILRDVGADFKENGRIYLPLDDLRQFNYSPQDLAAGLRNDNFLALMRFQAERAQGLYRSAQALLPPVDQRSMIAAEIMRTIYHQILSRMLKDDFQVFSQRYRLNALQKLLCIARVFLTPVRLNNRSA